MPFIDFPSDVPDRTPTFLVGGNSALNGGDGGPSLAPAGAVGLAVIAASTQASAITAVGAGRVIPKAINYIVALADNGATIVCASTPKLTFNAGLGAGFGVAIDGAFTYDGTASVTDERISLSLTPTAALLQVGTDTYKLVGQKV